MIDKIIIFTIIGFTMVVMGSLSVITLAYLFWVLIDPRYKGYIVEQVEDNEEE